MLEHKAKMTTTATCDRDIGYSDAQFFLLRKESVDPVRNEMQYRVRACVIGASHNE